MQTIWILHAAQYHWRKLFNGSVQELKDVEEIGHFLDGPLASCIYPSDVERSLAVTATLVQSQPDVPCCAFPPHLGFPKPRNMSSPTARGRGK